MNFVIDEGLPTMNEIIDASKSHWSVYADMKKANTWKVAIACNKLPKIEKKINLIITWYCKDRRNDKDNIFAGTKFIMDGLVEAKKIPNDGWNQIGDIHHSFAIDKKNPRVHVQIVEVES